jgi:hypothetical protein
MNGQGMQDRSVWSEKSTYPDYQFALFIYYEYILINSSSSRACEYVGNPKKLLRKKEMPN